MQVRMQVTCRIVGMLLDSCCENMDAGCKLMCIVLVSCTASDLQTGLSTGARAGQGAAPAQGCSTAIPVTMHLQPEHRSRLRCQVCPPTFKGGLAVPRTAGTSYGTITIDRRQAASAAAETGSAYMLSTCSRCLQWSRLLSVSMNKECIQGLKGRQSG